MARHRSILEQASNAEQELAAMQQGYEKRNRRIRELEMHLQETEEQRDAV